MTAFPWWPGQDYVNFGPDPATTGNIRGSDDFRIYYRYGGANYLVLSAITGAQVYGNASDTFDIDGLTVTVTSPTISLVGDVAVGSGTEALTADVDTTSLDAATSHTWKLSGVTRQRITAGQTDISESGIPVNVLGMLYAAEDLDVTDRIYVHRDNIGSATSTGLSLTNIEPATVGLEQYSPSTQAVGQAFNTGGAGSEMNTWRSQGWSYQGNPPILVHSWWSRRAVGAEVPIFHLLNLAGNPMLSLGDLSDATTVLQVTAAHIKRDSVADPVAGVTGISIEAGDIEGAGAFTAGTLSLKAGIATGAAQTGGNVELYAGEGPTGDGSIKLTLGTLSKDGFFQVLDPNSIQTLNVDAAGFRVRSIGGLGEANIIECTEDYKLGFFASAPIVQQTLAGALSTVADAPAKAVLQSIVDILTDYGLTLDGTT